MKKEEIKKKIISKGSFRLQDGVNGVKIVYRPPKISKPTLPKRDKVNQKKN